MKIKQDPGAEVLRSNLVTAQQRWTEFYGEYKSSGPGSFASFIGVTRLNFIKNHRAGVLGLRRSAVDKIMLLNSPHWYTILKAREAKKLP